MLEKLKQHYFGLFNIEARDNYLQFEILSDDYNSLNHAIIDDLIDYDINFDVEFDIDDYDQTIAIIKVKLADIEKLLNCLGVFND